MDKDKIKQLCKQYEKKELRVDQFMDALEKEGIPCWVAFVIGDLHRKVSYLTNINKLNYEDQAIAAKWEKERDERSRVYDLVAEAEERGDKATSHKLIDDLLHSTPHQCEHERSIWSTCGACLDIERTLFPDMFEDEEDDS